MSFIDEVLQAREADLRDEVGAARVVQESFDDASARLRKRVKELKALEKAGMLTNPAATRKHVQSILQEVDVVSQATANQMGPAIDRMRKQVVNKTIAKASQLTSKEAGRALSLEATFTQVPTEAVHEMATRPLVGTTPTKGMKRIAARFHNDIKKRLTSGLVAGDSAKEITKDISKITGQTESAAARLVRTNLAAASNDALRTTYEANADVLDGFIWDATLDERVCARCGSLHGTFYKLGEKPPGPPLHPNCRCVLVPHLIDEEEELKDQREYKKARPLTKSGERSRRTTKVKADTQFDDWLRKQPAGSTKRVTGSKLKDDLWRSGKVDLDDIVKPDKAIRTDDEVLQRALSMHPHNKKLQSLAKKRGVKAVKRSTIVSKDRAIARKQNFVQGVKDQPVTRTKPTVTKTKPTVTKTKPATKTRTKPATKTKPTVTKTKTKPTVTKTRTKPATKTRTKSVAAESRAKNRQMRTKARRAMARDDAKRAPTLRRTDPVQKAVKSVKGKVPKRTVSATGKAEFPSKEMTNKFRSEGKTLLKKATKLEKDAALSYTDNAEVNNILRTGGQLVGDESNTIKGMDSLFKKSKPLSEPVKVTRWATQTKGPDGWTAPNYIPKPGAVFTDKGFTSTTVSEKAAKELKEELGDGWGYSPSQMHEIEIEVPAGAKGVYMEGALGSKHYWHQKEMVLPRGSKFRVKSKTLSKTILEVIL